MEHYLRYRIIWRLLRFFVTPYIKLKFHYSREVCHEKGPLLVMCNHNTDWDPLLVGSAFPEYMSFVASAHIFRWGWLTSLLQFLVAPIARLKGATAVDTTMTTIKRLKKGVSVCIFPEGNRSFTGITEEIHPATAKLVKASKATLVTYRIHGGYFTSPRWSGSKMRPGKMVGEVVGIYSPEKLKEMTPAQIHEVLEHDLFCDAYADQGDAPVKYRTKERAKGLNSLLWLCPQCQKLDPFEVKDDTISCSCGFHARYNEYGFMEGDHIPSNKLSQWDQWQTTKLHDYIDEKLSAYTDDAVSSQGSGIESVLFEDDHMQLIEILSDGTTQEMIPGKMLLYPDRLEVCGQPFSLDSIHGFSLRGPQTIDLDVIDHHYDIKSPDVKCTRKYLLALQYLQQKNK